MAQFDVTVDDAMAEFVSDMNYADDELSDSIWTCVDNFIDSEVVKMMDSEESVFETDRDSASLPFNFILDKVMEKVDTVEDISSKSYMDAMTNFEDNTNKYDPDYCDDINFNEITPEDFQLYISKKDNDSEENHIDGDTSGYDSVFNA
jgi:hypothetical protein